jgi:hypothetical protein
MTAAVEVESPPYEMVLVERMSGQVKVRALSLLLKVVQSVAVRRPRTAVVAEGRLKVKVPEEFVMPQSLLMAVVEVARVMAPVTAAPAECAREVRPLLMEEVAVQVGMPFR